MIVTEVNCGICDGAGVMPKEPPPGYHLPEYAEEIGTPCYWCDATGNIYLDEGQEPSYQLVEMADEFDDVQAEFAA
jgi:hypothetical protein